MSTKDVMLTLLTLLVVGGIATALSVAATRLGEQRRELRQPLGGAAIGLSLLGSLLAWTTFRGYPGQLSASFFLGGARIYTLVLAIALALIFVDVPGRRRAGTFLAAGLVAIPALNIALIAKERGGLGALHAGVYVTLLGGLLGLAAFATLDEDAELRTWRLPSWGELLLVAASVGGMLFAIVYGLALEDGDRTSRFVSYLFALTAGILAMNALGLTTAVQRAYERNRPVAITAMFLAAAAFPFTQGTNAHWLRVAASVGVFAAAAIGLNIVVGLAGLLDLGYIAFFGIGAYIGGLLGGAELTTLDVHLPFVVVIVIAAIGAAIFGVIIGAPTLRLRGDYLAIVTLGFGEIFRIAANNADGITRGPNGIANIPDLALGGVNFGEKQTIFGVELAYFANYYFLELLLIAAVVLVFVRLNSSRIGRAWVAIREDETAAEAMGVNTMALKLLAFAIGAFLAGAAGAVNAHVGTQVSPESFTFFESVLLLAAVVLGGMGTVPGAIIGAAVLYAIPEKLRPLQDYRLLLFGIALIVMMRFRPEGIIASTRRKREFHDDDPDEGDAMGAAQGTGLSGKAVMP